LLFVDSKTAAPALAVDEHDPNTLIGRDWQVETALGPAQWRPGSRRLHHPRRRREVDEARQRHAEVAFGQVGRSRTPSDPKRNVRVVMADRPFSLALALRRRGRERGKDSSWDRSISCRAGYFGMPLATSSNLSPPSWVM